jgi:hypothetical protein
VDAPEHQPHQGALQQDLVERVPAGARAWGV